MELTAEQVWSRITDAAQDVLPEQTFRTWLSSTEAVNLSDDTLVVGAPTKFAVEWIEDKYGDLLRELAERQLGRSLGLRFEHRGKPGRLDFPEISGDDDTDAEPDRPPADRPGEEPDEAGLNERYKIGRAHV